jgi:hypothetical protein
VLDVGSAGALRAAQGSRGAVFRGDRDAPCRITGHVCNGPSAGRAALGRRFRRHRPPVGTSGLRSSSMPHRSVRVGLTPARVVMSGLRIGYARVSTEEQDPTAQRNGPGQRAGHGRRVRGRPDPLPDEGRHAGRQGQSAICAVSRATKSSPPHFRTACRCNDSSISRAGPGQACCRRKWIESRSRRAGQGTGIRALIAYQQEPGAGPTRSTPRPTTGRPTDRRG